MEYNFKRIENDTNGNPRYVLHYLQCMPNCFESLPAAEKYAATCKLMNKVGGRKYHNKKYGGGIAFQSYNNAELSNHIDRVKKDCDDAYGKICDKREHHKYERILLDGISADGFEGCEYYRELKTDADAAIFSYYRFTSEYAWRIERTGFYRALEEWLSGLAINIPYMNSDILRLAGMEEADEKAQDKILDNYWKFMAMRLIGIWRHYRVIN